MAGGNAPPIGLKRPAMSARLDRVTAGSASLWRTLSDTTVPRWLGGPRAGGLTDQMVALGDVRGPTGGIRVRRGGGRQVAAELVQVAADGVPPVPLAEHPPPPGGLPQPGGGAADAA